MQCAPGLGCRLCERDQHRHKKCDPCKSSAALWLGLHASAPRTPHSVSSFAPAGCHASTGRWQSRYRAWQPRHGVYARPPFGHEAV